MTLKKLLLGSSAVMFAAGAGISTAQAADPNPAGLVVTTMANYVEQCNNGNGWTKKDWCITLAGSITWSTTIGTKITYGANPWMRDANNPAGAIIADAATSTFDLFGQPVSYFGLTPVLTVSVSKPTDAGNLTLIFGVGTSGLTATSLAIGPWTFTSDSVRYRNTFGAATITATLAEPGRLGWIDPRAPTSAPAAPNAANFAYGPGYAGPWPDFAIDVNLDVGAAEVTTGFNVGQRTNPIDNFDFVTLGGYLQAALSAGPADLTLRADWDRVNASEDGGGQPVFAYGFRAQAAIDVGNLTITPAFGWSHNYGYYGYKYSEHELGNYLFAALNVSAPLGEQLTLTTGVEFTRGPDHPFDAVIEANAGLRFEPDAASPLYVSLVGKYQRQLGAQQLSAWNVTLSVGAAF